MSNDALTREKLMASMRLLAPAPAMRVMFSAHALKDSEQRNFPVSKNRSKRIHKKLVKRFGGEFRKVPCIWKYGDTIVAHPVFRREIETAACAVDRGGR